MKRRVSMAVAAVFMFGACGEKGSGGAALELDAISAVDFNLVKSPDFAGNSVNICGIRDQAADSKYPCLSHKCQCFNFDTLGRPVDPSDPREQGRFEDLCPSSDVPVSNWTFEYIVYSEKDCGGTALTNTNPYHPELNPHNFVCYDVANLRTESDPNKSIEMLMPGQNCNEIICVTKNASKFWDFDVCVDVTPQPGCADTGSGLRCPEPPTTELLLDCQCVVVGDSVVADSLVDGITPPLQCRCDEGIAPYHPDIVPLPRGCTFVRGSLPDQCLIKCVQQPQ